MSYDECKYITLDEKNNKIYATLTTNNVYPFKWQKRELYEQEIDCSFDDKFLLLFADIEQGNIQFYYLNDGTINFIYAMYKVNEYYEKNNIDSYNDLYKKFVEIWRNNKDKTIIEALREVYSEPFEIFKNAVKERIKGNYKVVVFDKEYNVCKIGQYNSKKGNGYGKFWYGGEPLLMPYKQAYIFVSDMNSDYRQLKIIKVD